MRNLARPLLRLLGRDDRGAVAVLVAVLLGGGVLLGMGALVIDVGQIYQNRAELQNGADAAALAVAQQCAQGTCTQASALATAESYATHNASALTQGQAGVACVRGSDSLSCGINPVGTGLTDCPADPGVGVNFVDVQTETTMGSGSTLLPPVFAETLVGSSTYTGTTVKACAQAEWGAPGGLALTFSNCEWSEAAGGAGNPVLPTGNRYWAEPGYPTSGDDVDTTFIIHSGNGNNNASCPSGPAGQDAPGAFGWTADPNNDCTTVITSGFYDTSTGNNASHACEAALTELVQSRDPVSVPIYSVVNGNGNNTVYTFYGYASMVITGFSVPGDSVADWLDGPMLCSPPDTCVDGYLTSNSVSQTADQPGDIHIKLTG